MADNRPSPAKQISDRMAQEMRSAAEAMHQFFDLRTHSMETYQRQPQQRALDAGR